MSLRILTTHTQIFHCPQCGGILVDVSSLAGGQASCRACPWRGTNEELLFAPLEHTLGSEEELKRAFYGDIKKVFSQEYGVPLLRLLLRWGYLEEMPGKPGLATQVYARRLGRYIAAIVEAVGRATIETREQIELERVGREDKES